MIDRLKERIAIKIAWMLPRRLVMWCAFRVGANATQGPHSNQIVPDLTFMDAMDRWN